MPETWIELAVLSLIEFQTVVLPDADMLIIRNIDELMDIELGSRRNDGRATVSRE